MLQLNPYAAVSKKNAELVSAKNIRAKAPKVAKASKKPAPANPMAVRASKMKATESGELSTWFYGYYETIEVLIYKLDSQANFSWMVKQIF